MKLSRVIWTTLAAIVCLLGAWTLVENAHRFKAKPPKPIDFNAQDYPLLHEHLGNDAFDVIHTAKYGLKWTDSTYLSDQNLLEMSFYSDDKPSVSVFFDKNGKQVAVLSKVNEGHYERRNNVFLTLDGYITVSHAGVSKVTPYAKFNNGAPVAAVAIENLVRQSSQVYAIAHYSMPKDRTESRLKLNTVILEIDGVWTKATTTSDKFIGDKHDPRTSQLRTQRIETAPQADSGEFKVVRDWFDQQEYSKKTNASWGSPTGHNTPAYWRGTGYYTIALKDARLRFSLSGDVQYVDFNGTTKAHYMWHPDLNFILIRRSADDHIRPYIIKPRLDGSN